MWFKTVMSSFLDSMFRHCVPLLGLGVLTFAQASLLTPEYSVELSRILPFVHTDLDRLSVQHQNDMLKALYDEELQIALQRANVDVASLREGITDSDAGKLAVFSSSAFLFTSEASDRFLDFLKGLEPDTHAGKDLRELLDSSGFKGKTLFNPELTNSTIRQILRAAPVLRSFLHEIPGIKDAMVDRNADVISSEQFKKRVGANLFHNDGGGSEFAAGFWQKKFTDDIVAKAILEHPDPLVRAFFELTVFAGIKQGGATPPRYPAPISVEGFFHAILDRMSQGTRGGIIKIFVQNGRSLAGATEVLTHVPEDTFLQLTALGKAVTHAKFLTSEQREALQEVLTKFLLRLQKQNEFLKKAVKLERVGENVQRIVLSYSTNTGSPDILDPFTSGASMEAKLTGLLQFEEQLHGEPLFLSGHKPATGACQ